MSHYITTHDAKGQSVYSNKTPTEPHTHLIPGGTLEILYSSHQFPPSLSTEADIDQYAHDRTHIMEGGICPPHGTAAAIVSFEPNAASVWHRTMSLDVMVILEGVTEAHLEGGEVRILKAGDSMVQPGTMHLWKNVTPGDGWAKAVAFASAIQQPFEIAGKTLGTEFKM
ncbi:hypothetical protein LTR91_011436 [Friedmanniomyces endolithicus]|uniref:Uncharacterized protein n=1 Tax=Friedmanniomyces endolithicus TaxID=329885 RepID=A0AAN6KHK3_9PEZI|nr:hypothetical protein LTR35_017401 [Friedmanniomyces endolithicus]KAK0270589.1 hypothetical protein LTS00_016914 [Friedmanniomyces endolithicus]KAK0313969.1 hypothetical protein LTR82_013279 [Friedmanniomyces endolithicus]KAK0920303.1 hypothetical protein LTR57_009959 [Friedmanniomyces endolithicus]KAK0973742.1 hypothetical protein LTR54_017261 [Friedmanniomyces endolithicus]